MASAKAIALMESIYGRVDTQVRAILATLPDMTVPAQDDGVVIASGRRIFNFQGPGVAVSEDPARRRVNVFIPGGVSGSSTNHILSQLASDTRALTLWNGSSNDSPPANWYTSAFNDAGWSAAVNNTEADDYSAIIPGAIHLWSSATGTNTAEQVLVRQRFTLPPGEVASASLLILTDSQMHSCYINGTLIGVHADTPWGSTPGSPATAYTFSLSPSVLLANPAVNVIACMAQNNLDVNVGGSVIFDITAIMNTVTTLGTVVNKISADVTLTTINTYYDGPVVSLTAGTWLLTGAVTVIDTGGAANITARLWDGTTSETSGQGYIATSSANIPIALSAIVTISSTTSYRIAAANATRGTTGAIKAATPQNTSGQNASFLNAVKIG